MLANVLFLQLVLPEVLFFAAPNKASLDFLLVLHAQLAIRRVVLSLSADGISLDRCLEIGVDLLHNVQLQSDFRTAKRSSRQW